MRGSPFEKRPIFDFLQTFELFYRTFQRVSNEFSIIIVEWTEGNAEEKKTGAQIPA